ncbi:hypothetical protein T310_2298 [Rasamsonia emersonii CBS 393.64]|uniref:Uncharacterized protein n=1 Tax=Rasamsonia emersonii (strain ATCC 16479 / CBS 393.64 / IMI 116815) TaxID=1408163 RepID=A0A0F4YZZ2_RASE3|nr:hypothetical protein T310_2298 [Rasamsonia emersonii CBS 393.64]KKA23665.1 hypothetical protein T310_2298 [Rasamsonia emersonii CBS 393.64]
MWNLLFTPILLLSSINLASSTKVTLPNWNFKYDSQGNVLDAHGKYYFYGTAYNCGFRWRTDRGIQQTTPPPFAASKPTPRPTSIPGPTRATSSMPRRTSGRAAAPSTAPVPAQSPAEPAHERVRPVDQHRCVQVRLCGVHVGQACWPLCRKNSPVMARERGGGDFGNGDFGIVIGPDGKGYIAYDNAPAIPKHSIFQNPNLTYGIVQELSEDYTDVTDNYVITDLANIEAWDMIYRDGWWYLIRIDNYICQFGHICGYCTGTDTSYIKSRDPMGLWLAKDRVYFTNTSCGGQHNMVAQLPSGNSNSSDPYVWLYGSDIWTADVNEGKAGSHWEPLTFLPDGSISPLDCTAPEYVIDVPVTESQVIDVVANATVSSAPGNYTWECGFGIHDRSILYQFFQAPKSGNVTEIGVNIAQQSNNAPVTISLVHVYNISELFSPTGGVEPLWSKTYPVDTIGWSFPMGEWYALELAATAVSIPYCYLQRETDYDTSNIFVPPKSFLAEIRLGKYPLYPLMDKELRYYVQIAD